MRAGRAVLRRSNMREENRNKPGSDPSRPSRPSREKFRFEHQERKDHKENRFTAEFAESAEGNMASQRTGGVVDIELSKDA